MPGASKMARLPLVEPRNGAHLYRHLLREASYLPPACRPYITSRIQAEFANHRHDAAPKRSLQRANHELRFLRAANLGDLTRMRRVLMLAFGRAGRRRRQLVEDLRRKEPPADSAQLEGRLRESPPSRRRDWLDKWDTDKMLAFTKSQACQTLRLSPRPTISTGRAQLDPNAAVPAVNAWGTPPGPRFARAKIRQWWKATVNRILPPVEKGEWELLRALATGAAGREWDAPPKRAAKTGPEGEAPWQWASYLTAPVRAVERPRSRSLKALYGFEGCDGSAVDGRATHISTYTRRSWQRLYAQIFRLTSTMEERPQRGSRWHIEWGTIPIQPSTPSSIHREFFEGVDTKGRVPERPKAANV